MTRHLALGQDAAAGGRRGALVAAMLAAGRRRLFPRFFYTPHVDAGGIPVSASPKVSPTAMPGAQHRGADAGRA